MSLLRSAFNAKKLNIVDTTNFRPAALRTPTLTQVRTHILNCSKTAGARRLECREQVH